MRTLTVNHVMKLACLMAALATPTHILATDLGFCDGFLTEGWEQLCLFDPIDPPLCHTADNELWRPESSSLGIVASGELMGECSMNPYASAKCRTTNVLCYTVFRRHYPDEPVINGRCGSVTGSCLYENDSYCYPRTYDELEFEHTTMVFRCEASQPPSGSPVPPGRVIKVHPSLET